MTNQTHSITPMSDLAVAVCASWNAKRARLHLLWAEDNLERLYGYRDGSAETPTEVITKARSLYDEIRSDLWQLLATEPRTVAGAVLMLKAVAQIMADHELRPDETDVPSRGDALRILLNAVEALGCVDPEQAIRVPV
jgi:hypothetical protein